MKKVLFLLGTMLAFIACGDKSIDMESPVADAQDDGFKVNITISRAGSTKAAYVKSDFADGDKVFIKFDKINDGKYLEMKYNAAAQDWTATAMNGLTASDLEDATSRNLTAVYLPYGSDVTLTTESNKARLYINKDNGLDGLCTNDRYYGYFLQDKGRAYTFIDGILNADINLIIHPAGEGYGNVHFNVTGFTPGNKYVAVVLDWDDPDDYITYGVKYFNEIVLTYFSIGSFGLAGGLSYDEGYVCYEDSGNLTFSYEFGLDSYYYKGDNTCGTYKYIGFMIVDLTDHIKYYKRFTDKVIHDGDYIGLGNISSDFFSTWEKRVYDPDNEYLYEWE